MVYFINVQTCEGIATVYNGRMNVFIRMDGTQSLVSSIHHCITARIIVSIMHALARLSDGRPGARFS